MENSLVRIQNLSQKYIYSSVVSPRRKDEKVILNDISLTICKGEVFALVGESGSGKTTLGKCILKFIQPDSGNIYFENINITHLREKNFKPYRKKMQMIFQNPLQALNQKQTVGSCILEVIKRHEKNQNKNYERLLELLRLVHLDENSILKYPFELSGGQQQRLVIARALTTRPSFIVADEPTSSLDAVIKLQIIELFKELQHNLKMTILFISHDLAVVSKIANRIGVMYKGEMVELAPQEVLYNFPSHPYTKLLLKSIKIEKFLQSSFVQQQKTFPDTQGCKFLSRCPIKNKICYSITPELKNINELHQVRCHFISSNNQKEKFAVTKTMGI